MASLKDLRNKITPFYDKQWNAVGKYGTGCIYDRIKEKILDLGGELFLNHEKPEYLDPKIKRKIDYILSSRITSVERQRWRTLDSAINELNKVQLILFPFKVFNSDNEIRFVKSILNRKGYVSY